MLSIWLLALVSLVCLDRVTAQAVQNLGLFNVCINSQRIVLEEGTAAAFCLGCLFENYADLEAACPPAPQGYVFSRRATSEIEYYGFRGDYFMDCNQGNNCRQEFCCAYSPDNSNAGDICPATDRIPFPAFSPDCENCCPSRAGQRVIYVDIKRADAITNERHLCCLYDDLEPEPSIKEEACNKFERFGGDLTCKAIGINTAVFSAFCPVVTPDRVQTAASTLLDVLNSLEDGQLSGLERDLLILDGLLLGVAAVVSLFASPPFVAALATVCLAAAAFGTADTFCTGVETYCNFGLGKRDLTAECSSVALTKRAPNACQQILDLIPASACDAQSCGPFDAEFAAGSDLSLEDAQTTADVCAAFNAAKPVLDQACRLRTLAMEAMPYCTGSFATSPSVDSSSIGSTISSSATSSASTFIDEPTPTYHLGTRWKRLSIMKIGRDHQDQW